MNLPPLHLHLRLTHQCWSVLVEMKHRAYLMPHCRIWEPLSREAVVAQEKVQFHWHYSVPCWDLDVNELISWHTLSRQHKASRRLRRRSIANRWALPVSTLGLLYSTVALHTHFWMAKHQHHRNYLLLSRFSCLQNIILCSYQEHKDMALALDSDPSKDQNFVALTISSTNQKSVVPLNCKKIPLCETNLECPLIGNGFLLWHIKYSVEAFCFGKSFEYIINTLL